MLFTHLYNKAYILSYSLNSNPAFNHKTSPHEYIDEGFASVNPVNWEMGRKRGQIMTSVVFRSEKRCQRFRVG
jgi:hypothetical protein